MQNLYNANQKKNDFLDLLRILHENTESEFLKDSLCSLINKVSALSQEELSRLCEAVLKKKIVATMNNPF
jgi:hypothetical protein